MTLYFNNLRIFITIVLILLPAVRPAHAQGPAAPDQLATETIDPAHRDRFKIVIIDPGHGGQDPGAQIPGRPVEKQITLTMEVVEAILKSRQMDWADVSRAVGYFKDIENAPLFGQYCEKKGLPPLPTAIAHADICRDDLLYVIEVDAVTV